MGKCTPSDERTRDMIFVSRLVNKLGHVRVAKSKKLRVAANGADFEFLATMIVEDYRDLIALSEDGAAEVKQALFNDMVLFTTLSITDVQPTNVGLGFVRGRAGGLKRRVVLVDCEGNFPFPVIPRRGTAPLLSSAQVELLKDAQTRSIEMFLRPTLNLVDGTNSTYHNVTLDHVLNGIGDLARLGDDMLDSVAQSLDSQHRHQVLESIRTRRRVFQERFEVLLEKRHTIDSSVLGQYWRDTKFFEAYREDYLYYTSRLPRGHEYFPILNFTDAGEPAMDHARRRACDGFLHRKRHEASSNTEL